MKTHAQIGGTSMKQQARSTAHATAAAGRVSDRPSGMYRITDAPPSSRRAIPPLRPITLLDGRGARVVGTILPLRTSSGKSTPPASARDFIGPIGVAVLCSGLLWLLTVARTLVW